MTTRTRYVAEYLYPGSFLPESAHRELPFPTYQTAVELGPDEDKWYGVRISTITEKRYTAVDGAEIWVEDDNPSVESFIVGTEVGIHDYSISGPEFEILRSNIRSNGPAVRTRLGNYQFRSDWNTVVAP